MKQESPTGSSAGCSAIDLSTILAVLAILFATSLPYNFYNTRSNRSGNHALSGVDLVDDVRVSASEEGMNAAIEHMSQTREFTSPRRNGARPIIARKQ